MIVATHYGGLVEIHEITELPEPLKNMYYVYPEDVYDLIRRRILLVYKVVKRSCSAYCPCPLPREYYIPTTVHYGRWKKRMNHILIIPARSVWAARVRPPRAAISRGESTMLFKELCEEIKTYADFDDLVRKLNEEFEPHNIRFYP